MIYMSQAVAMADHFDKIQKLKDPIPGVPNFRRVPGYKVYCCGQPTLAGLEAALEKVRQTLCKYFSWPTGSTLGEAVFVRPFVPSFVYTNFICSYLSLTFVVSLLNAILFILIRYIFSLLITQSQTPVSPWVSNINTLVLNSFTLYSFSNLYFRSSSLAFSLSK